MTEEKDQLNKSRSLSYQHWLKRRRSTKWIAWITLTLINPLSRDLAPTHQLKYGPIHLIQTINTDLPSR